MASIIRNPSIFAKTGAISLLTFHGHKNIFKMKVPFIAQ